MDSYESNIPKNENQAASPAEPAVAETESVHNAQTPFADSSCVMEQTVSKDAQEAAPAKKKGKAGKVLKTVLCSVLILALVAGSCIATAWIINDRWEARMDLMSANFYNRIHALQEQIADSAADTGNSVSGTPNVTVDGSLTPGQVYAANVKSVVMIYNRSGAATSTGSGFVLTADGYVVTNYHVVEGASQLTVTMHNGKEYTAKMVGGDSANDVALLKVEATDLQAVKIGSSTALIVGDQVVAIGNPLGELTSTLTVGYISAKERNVSTDGMAINMIQTDAAINSGNSGGPLFNMKGEVIGITTAKYSGTSSSGASIEGIGFAIPIDDVYDMLSDLKEFGYVTGAYLGVSVSDTDSEAASYFGFPVGAYVREAVEGYCAHKAGIQAKDIIVNLGGYDVGGVSDLTRILRKFEAGQTTTITVYRSGREVTLSITLDAKPQETQPQAEPSNSQGSTGQGGIGDWFSQIAPFFGGGNG